MKSLNEIQTTLSAALGSEALVQLVNTRITLRTGVDLRTIQNQDNLNPELVAKVIEALTALGFSASTLQLVAQKRGHR